MSRQLTILASGICLLFLIVVQPFVTASTWHISLVLLVMLFPIVIQLATGGIELNFFRFYPLALFSLLIVHVQYYIDYLLGNVSVHSRMWADDYTVMTSLMLIGVGIVSFVFSYSIFGKRNYRSPRARTRSCDATRYLFLVSVILLFGYFGTASREYLRGSYGVEEVGQAASYIIQLFKCTAFAYIILKTRNAKIQGVSLSGVVDFLRILGWPFVLLLALYLVSVLVSGDRGPLMTYGLCLLANYCYLRGAAPSATLSIVVLLTGAMFVTFLGELRQVGRGLPIAERVGMLVEDGFSEKSEKSVLPPTQPLAKSVRTLHTVVAYVPQSHPHTFGYFLLRSAISIVPFSGPIANALAPTNSVMYHSTASFTTVIVYGHNYTSGEGTTAIADLYIEFGLLGVILGMFFYGFVVRLSEKTFLSRELTPLWLHVLAVFYFSNAIYIARGSVFTDLKLIAWTLLIIFCNSIFSNVMSARRSK